MTYILAILGLFLIVAIMIIGFIVSYWVCIAGISAIYMKQKGPGIALILSSIGSVLTAMAIAIGCFLLLNNYFPL